ncbi:MAG: M48 family metalloprotease [Anaerolineae bacterium]
MEEKTLLTEEEIDLTRQKKAKEYACLRHRLLLADLALGGIYLLAFLRGPSQALKAWSLGLTSHPFLAVAFYFWALALIYGILLFPLEYYGGFVLPHRYGLSTQTHKGWGLDRVKSLFLGLLLGTLILEVIYYLLRAFPSLWWLIAGLFILLFTILLTNLAPVLVLPLFFRLTPLPEGEIAKRLTDLAERAGTKVQGVFTIDLSSKTRAANAALIGLGNTRSIVLGDTLYKGYTPDEIETVLAHELGHHAHGDMARGIILQSALILLGFYLTHLALNWGVPLLAFEAPHDIAALPLFALTVGAFLVLTTPLANLYSRSREWAADRYALEMTGKPEAFISVMARLANQNLAEVEPEPWVEFLLYSHPAIGKRIKQGKEFMMASRRPPYSRRGNYQKYLNPNPLQQYLIRRFHQRVGELVRETGAIRILDAGCGEGFTIERLDSDFYIQGVDNDLSSLLEARERNPNSDFYLSDIRDLPLASHAFPLILCLEVLEHLADPHPALEELRRVTSCHCLISVPHEPFFRLANLLRGKNLRAWGNDLEHIHNWTAGEFIRLLEGYFEIEKVAYSFPWVMALCRKG